MSNQEQELKDEDEDLFTKTLFTDLIYKYDTIMELKIFIDSSDEEVKNKYINAIYNHNLKLKNNINHIDAGFDLFTPKDIHMYCDTENVIDYDIICSATISKKIPGYYKHYTQINTGFYMYPRSSISKSSIRLANNVGIIDAGYRGHLMGVFDCRVDNVKIDKFSRYLQICAPGLIPIIVSLVSSKEELGEKTERGEGGFGSTGK